jgi:BirA family biotin operon repressor/biotin-[acetyl-CoA-carboxylase] ligase
LIDDDMINPHEFTSLSLPTGWRIEAHTQVGSTNDIAKQRARAGAAGGLVVVADVQSSGRGRMGRSWEMPAGAGLPLSILLRPTWLQPADAYVLTMLAAVSLCQAIEQVAPVQALLKWPNDLLLRCADGTLRKAAGILTELDLRDGAITWAVIGIGVNVAWQPLGTIDGRDLAHTATSLALASGVDVPRRDVLGALLGALAQGIEALRAGQQAALAESWRSRLATIGQSVTVRMPDRMVVGVAEGVTATGALLVRDAHGQVQIITAGDVEA